MKQLACRHVRHEQGKYRLVRDRKIIREAFVWYNGTLGDKRRTIGVVGVLLEDTMPMLQGGDMKVPIISHKGKTLQQKLPDPRSRS